MSKPAAAHRILIVDDSSAMRMLLTAALRRLPDTTIEHAEDGLAAFKKISEAPRPYHLVLLDLNMPVMDGVTLLDRLREDHLSRTTKIAVVTTENDAVVEADVKKRGARWYLRKPIDRRAVEVLLQEALGLALPR